MHYYYSVYLPINILPKGQWGQGNGEDDRAKIGIGVPPSPRLVQQPAQEGQGGGRIGGCVPQG